MEYLYYELEQPRYTINECRQFRLTYGYPLKIKCRLRSRGWTRHCGAGDIPWRDSRMIGGGEFIINGPRVIVSQLHRSPGVDFLIESKEGDRYTRRQNYP